MSRFSCGGSRPSPAVDAAGRTDTADSPADWPIAHAALERREAVSLSCFPPEARRRITTLSPKPHVVDPASVAEEFWNDPVKGQVAWRTLLSGDRTPSAGLTLGVAEVIEQAGAEARLHRHAQAEAYYILSGRGVLRIENEEHPLAAGVTAFIPGGAWHAARAVGAEPLRLLYVFAADSFADIAYEFPEAPGAGGGVGRLSTSADSPSA